MSLGWAAHMVAFLLSIAGFHQTLRSKRASKPSIGYIRFDDPARFVQESGLSSIDSMQALQHQLGHQQRDQSAESRGRGVTPDRDQRNERLLRPAHSLGRMPRGDHQHACLRGMSGAGRAAGPESTGGGVFTALATLQQLDPCGCRLNGRVLLAEIGRTYHNGRERIGCYYRTEWEHATGRVAGLDGPSRSRPAQPALPSDLRGVISIACGQDQGVLALAHWRVCERKSAIPCRRVFAHVPTIFPTSRVVDAARSSPPL